MASTEFAADAATLRSLLGAALPASRAETIQELIEISRVRTVREGETVFRQGELVPLILIIRGYGVFNRTTADGQQLALGVAKPGVMYGFSGISSVTSGSDMVALTACDVATWNGPAMRPLVTADPDFALEVIDRQSGFIAMVTEKVDGFLHQDARRRVVRVLIRHRDLFFGDRPVLSRSHLPALVGTSREMTGRVLRQLEREGMLARVGRQGLRLLRPDRLDADESLQEVHAHRA
jgi:CRP-like cAMP-binding protein